MNLDAAENTAGHAVSFMYHPTFLTDSRENVAEWIRAVFGRNGIYQRDFMKTMPFSSDYPVDYSYYVWISDVWMGIIDPTLLLAGDPDGRGLQVSTGMLSEIAWYAADADAIYQAARKHGVRVVNQSGQVIEETSLPKGTSLVSSDVVLTWLHPDDVGLSVEIANLTPDMEKLAARFLFPRHHPDWRPPELDLHDPMGIIRGAFHTVWDQRPPACAPVHCGCPRRNRHSRGRRPTYGCALPMSIWQTPSSNMRYRIVRNGCGTCRAPILCFRSPSTTSTTASHSW